MRIYNELKKRLQFDIEQIADYEWLVTTNFLDEKFEIIADIGQEAKDILENSEKYISLENIDKNSLPNHVDVKELLDQLMDISIQQVKETLIYNILKFLVEIIGKKEDNDNIKYILDHKTGFIQNICMDARIGEPGYYK